MPTVIPFHRAVVDDPAYIGASNPSGEGSFDVYTTWIETDMSRVETARRALGVTALAFVARATIDAIREFPALNAWMEGEKYTQHSDVNLGIAVSLGDDGLIVPVIHRAHELSVEGLAARIRDLARRARSGRHP